MQNSLANLEEIVAAIGMDREHGRGASTSRLGLLVRRLNVVETGQELGPRPGVEGEPGATLKFWCRR
jgi:hypothetical protein